jgi:hypothetical protein
VRQAGADPIHDQCPPSNLKKKNLVGIYKFKKYRYAKVPTLIFVLNPHLRFRKKKKNKKDKYIKITSNTPNNPKL